MMNHIQVIRISNNAVINAPAMISLNNALSNPEYKLLGITTEMDVHFYHFNVIG